MHLNFSHLKKDLHKELVLGKQKDNKTRNMNREKCSGHMSTSQAITPCWVREAKFFNLFTEKCKFTKKFISHFLFTSQSQMLNTDR